MPNIITVLHFVMNYSQPVNKVYINNYFLNTLLVSSESCDISVRKKEKVKMYSVIAENDNSSVSSCVTQVNVVFPQELMTSTR